VLGARRLSKVKYSYYRSQPRTVKSIRLLFSQTLRGWPCGQSKASVYIIGVVQPTKPPSDECSVRRCVTLSFEGCAGKLANNAVSIEVDVLGDPAISVLQQTMALCLFFCFVMRQVMGSFLQAHVRRAQGKIFDVEHVQGRGPEEESTPRAWFGMLGEQGGRFFAFVDKLIFVHKFETTNVAQAVNFGSDSIAFLGQINIPNLWDELEKPKPETLNPKPNLNPKKQAAAQVAVGSEAAKKDDSSTAVSKMLVEELLFRSKAMLFFVHLMANNNLCALAATVSKVPYVAIADSEECAICFQKHTKEETFKLFLDEKSKFYKSDLAKSLLKQEPASKKRATLEVGDGGDGPVPKIKAAAPKSEPKAAAGDIFRKGVGRLAEFRIKESEEKTKKKLVKACVKSPNSSNDLSL
jgi:hypothetical protein